MPTSRTRRLPKPDRRRALELLAGSPTGCTEALLFAYGITVEMLVGLIHAGLATATAERVVAGSRKIEVARVKITDAGRQALAAGDGEAMSRKAELDAILERRPDLKGKSLEAAKRIMRREARLSLRPRRSVKSG
jgi:hypothetical protein